MINNEEHFIFLIFDVVPYVAHFCSLIYISSNIEEVWNIVLDVFESYGNFKTINNNE